MPRARKPAAMKLLHGTTRKDRERPEPEFPVVKDLIDPPDWLVGTDAAAEWKRIVALLLPSSVLTDGDLTALGHLCNLHGAIVSLYRANRYPDSAALTQLRLYLAEFGMTPASRSKAAPVGGGKKKNPFTDLNAPAPKRTAGAKR